MFTNEHVQATNKKRTAPTSTEEANKREGLTSGHQLGKVLAVQLLEELVDTGSISLNANRGEDRGDLGLGGASVASEDGEKVGSEDTHFLGDTHEGRVRERNRRRRPRCTSNSGWYLL
jgi:hypothetical protein